MKGIRLYLVLMAVVLVCSSNLGASTLPFEEEVRINSIQPSGQDPFAVETNIPAVIEEVEQINEEINNLAENAGEDLEEAAQSAKKIVEHSVSAGESLWVIAQRLLGDGNRYREIIEANKDKYPSLAKNPDLILTGWVLKVPVDEPVADENPASAPEEDEEDDDASEVTIDDDSGSSAADVAQVPNWTTKEKIQHLQSAIDSANRRLLSQNRRIAALNTDTIRFLIDNKFMTEEEWMGMNPPAGYTYRLDRLGKVELVDANNEPLTNEQIAQMDNQTAQAAEEPEETEEAAQDDDEEETSAVIADEDSQPAAEEEAEDEEQAQAADKAEDEEQAPAAEVEAEAQAAAETHYQKMLESIGVPDVSEGRDYYKAIREGSRFMSEGIFSGRTEFFKFVNAVDYPQYDVRNLQRQLKKLQERYEKQVRAGKTDKFLGIFGSTIESTGKEIANVKAKLEKAWGELKTALKAADTKAQELKASVKADNEKAVELQKELDAIDIYDSANASEVQSKTKAIKECRKNIEKAEKKLDRYAELKKVFK
jgi:nucleoid-associated protein YgaU